MFLPDGVLAENKDWLMLDEENWAMFDQENWALLDQDDWSDLLHKQDWSRLVDKDWDLDNGDMMDWDDDMMTLDEGRVNRANEKKGDKK